MSVKTLIVDDDDGVIFLHELMVAESGFSEHTTSFKQAKLALRHLKDRKEKDAECVIFLDINMPGMDGWEFLECLEREGFGNNIYVVMATSSVNSADRIKAGNYKHVVDFVEKPLSLFTCEKLKQQESLKHLFAGIEG